MDDQSFHRSLAVAGSATVALVGLSSAGPGLVGPGKRDVGQLSLAFDLAAVALAELSPVTVEQMALCRINRGREFHRHSAGVGHAGRFLTSAANVRPVDIGRIDGRELQGSKRRVENRP